MFANSKISGHHSSQSLVTTLPSTAPEVQSKLGAAITAPLVVMAHGEAAGKVMGAESSAEPVPGSSEGWLLPQAGTPRSKGDLALTVLSPTGTAPKSLDTVGRDGSWYLSVVQDKSR